MADVDSEAIRGHLDRLLASEPLEKSESSRKLLRYLVERALRGDAPKETEIAIDVFDRDASFNGADESVVRVAVRTLRLKLGEYYAGPGRNETLQFVIPKGGYRLAFVPREPSSVGAEAQAEPSTPPAEEAAPRARRGNGRVWAAVAGALLVASVGVNLHLLREPRSEVPAQIAGSPLWSGIADSNRPLMIMLGDLFMYTQVDPASGRTLFVRDPAINSSEELRAFLAGNPAIAPGRGAYYMSMIQKSTAIGMASVLQLVSHPGRRVQTRARDEVQNDDLRNHDIIYIGPLSRLGPLEGYYQLISRYRLEPDTSGLRDLVTQKLFLPQGGINEQHKEYGLAARLKGPAGNHIVIITPGSRNSGMLAAVQLFTSPEGMRTLEQRLRAESKSGALPDTFEVLFSVTSFEQSDVAAEIVEVHARAPGK